MKKRILVLALVMLFGFFLASCDDTPEVVELTSIVISGADDVTLDFDTDFNILTGVTALGNDGVDYTADLTYVTTADLLDGDMLDTTKVGAKAIRYEVAASGVTAQKWRYVTVSAPQGVDGAMLVNPDFALGTAGWDDPSVVYNGDGSTMALSVEEGALKAEVVAGSNPYTPRFGQMNVPFEIDTTYEVSFKAKSSVEKVINLQVGELLSASPWFTDFKPSQTEHRTITTEWATYSYKFTMTLDNPRGGVLFELGAIGGVGVDATVWFDDIAIEESTPDLDVSAPVLTGVVDAVNVLLGGTYNPLTGVTAFDLTDGDVTADIVVTIVDSESNPVTTIDTSMEGTYTVTYTVEDSLGNSGFLTSTVSVVGLLFSETNLIANPSFETALNETTPEWGLWVQDWGSAPVVTQTLDTTAGTLAIDVTGGGDAAWAVQVFQDGYITLEQGKTYKLSVTVMAEAERSINIAFGYGDPYVQYARQNENAVMTTETVVEFLFTVTMPTHDVKLTFELGSQAGFADGLVTFSNVALQELDAEVIVMNGNFDQTMAPWDTWYQNWGDMPTVTYEVVAGEFVITTDKGGDAFWAVQFNQLLDLEAAKTYTLSFDARATVARDINVELLGTSLLGDGKALFVLTTETQPFTVDLTTVDAVIGGKLSFELGATPTFAAGSVILDNISVVEKDVVDAPNLVLNGDAETIMYHNFFDDGHGTWAYSENGVDFVVTSLGGAAYQPHYYYIIDSLAPGEYTATFTMSSSVARDFRFNIVLPDSGYASLLPDTKYDFSLNADESTVITINFTVETMLTNVKVELDFGTLGDPQVSLIGTFTLEQFLIYPNFN